MVISSEFVTHVTIDVTPLNLGNNYSYAHFIKALAQDPQNIVEVYELIQTDDDITLSAQGNYGQVTLHTNGSDLADHLREYYEDIKWCADTDNYYYDTLPNMLGDDSDKGEDNE